MINSIIQKPGKLGFCLNFIVLVFSLILLTTSCEKTQPIEEEDPIEIYDETHPAEITVNRSSFEADPDGDNFTLRVKSTYLWKIAIPEDATWITCDVMSGDSSDVFTLVKFAITENTTAAERTAKVVVKSGKAKKTITVKQARATKTMKEGDVDVSKIYIPQELRSNNFYKSSSKWYYGRSAQSEHFIVFWDKGKYWDEYGDVTPTNSTNNSYKVNIEDLLKKAEGFYDVNINTLKFAEVGSGKSCLDKYKIMIFINYSTEWLATGAGYDNVIGALWVNPSSCQPVGSTIAHEIGHSFQYMVYCDQLIGGAADDSKTGWRYGFGAAGAGGNAFWEQSAQWQSFQSYPNEAFNNYYFQGFLDDCHKHPIHEDPRYSNYFIHWYWVHKHNIEIIGEIWRASKYPEDPIETYMRMFDLSVEDLNAELFDFARRTVTWDMDAIRSIGKNYIGRHTWSGSVTGGYYQVAKNKCPQTGGYNVIELKSFSAGADVKAEFVGIINDSNYNIIYPQTAGWRYGFVARTKTGTEYSEMFSDAEGLANWIVPEGTSRLWFVVSGAPSKYYRHAWDDDNTNDEQWPYKVKFIGADKK